MMKKNGRTRLLGHERSDVAIRDGRSARGPLKFIGTAPAFLEALKRIDRFATCDATVLILGETGTGKELAGRTIHYHSIRLDMS